MNTQITLDNLAKLKLSGMAKVYQGMLSTPAQDLPSMEQLMANLTMAEIQERAIKKRKCSFE